MDELSDVKELLSYYARGGAPDTLLGRKVIQTLGRLPREQRERVIEHLLDTRPKKEGLDYPAIRSAISAVGAGRRDYVEARDWVCDCCGMEFKYTQASSDELRLKGLHDYCPKCGFQPEWTIKIRAVADRGFQVDQRQSMRYEELKTNHLEKYGPGKEWFYSRQQDEVWESKQRRMAV